VGVESKIQWTIATFNPWRSCTRVSEGCLNCYAEKNSHRNPKVLGIWGKEGTREIAAESQWRGIIKLNEEAGQSKTRPRVFCASIADVFEGTETMPEAYHLSVAKTRDRLFAFIEETPNLDWLLLTKRPQNVPLMYDVWRHRTHRTPEYPPNLWLGATTENQRRTNERAPLIAGLRTVEGKSG